MSKLLLVEDDNNLREIYEARLQAEGYTIVTAKDGEDALVIAKAERPDLIISDIMMPKISGFEMLDILRNTDNLKDVPVIMLTALGQNDDQQRADKLGADRYLVKSQVTLEDIVRVTHELLGDGGDTTTATAAQSSPEAAPSVSTPPPTPVVETPAPAPPPAPPPEPVAPAPAPEAPNDATAAPPPATPAPAPPPAPPPEPVAPAPTTTDTDSTPPADTTSAAVPAAEPESSSDSSAPQDAPSDKAQPDADAARAAEQAESTTTAQEGAAVEARIEDFVTGASQEATPPEATPEGTTEESETSSSDSETSTDNSSTENADADQATADETATNDEASSEPAITITDKPADPETVVIKPTEPAETSPSEETAPPPTPPKSNTVTSSVVHDKVITPLEADPDKKDINTLLALEAVKEAKDKPAEVANPVIVDALKAPAEGEAAPVFTPQPTAVGAQPAPTSVITPAPGSISDDGVPATSTDTSASPSITKTSSALQPPSANEDPGADLNGISL